MLLSFQLMWLTRTPSGSASPLTVYRWLWLVTAQVPAAKSLTGWLPPWWPKRIRSPRQPLASAISR